MKKLFSSKKFCKIIIAIILIYTIITCISQSRKLKSYNSQKEYYVSQIEDLKDGKNDLEKEQQDVNSPEYIEKQARDKLDMYYPNERVYMTSQN